MTKNGIQTVSIYQYVKKGVLLSVLFFVFEMFYYFVSLIIFLFYGFGSGLCVRESPIITAYIAVNINGVRLLNCAPEISWLHKV